MLVIAAAGLLVPMDGKPRNYISDTPPESERGYTVPDTVYYQRRVMEGDLIELAAQAATAEVVAEDDASAAIEVNPVATKKKGGA